MYRLSHWVQKSRKFQAIQSNYVFIYVEGPTPVWLAANNGDADTLRCLLKLEGFMADSASPDGTTALAIAIGLGYTDIVGTMTEHWPLILSLPQLDEDKAPIEQ